MIGPCSLRWRLQAYYALLLLLAIALLTVLSIHWMRVGDRYRLDSLLREYQHSLMPALKGLEAEDSGQWKLFEALPAFDRASRGPEGMRRPGPDGPLGGPPNGPPGGAAMIPASALDQLLNDDFFFGVFDFDGKPLRLSRNFPDDIGTLLPLEAKRRDVLEDRNNYRVLLHREPGNVFTAIGYSSSWISAELSSQQWFIIGVSLLLFLVATGIGWFLIGQTLRPIQAIRKAAIQITAGELNTRIPVTARKGDEIGELTENLNETFAQFELMFERQKRFTSEASHELRTPVAVILGYCQMALEKGRSREQVEEAVRACCRAGVRMKNLTNDLLELARIESGEIHFEFTSCSIRDVCEEALELIEPLATEKNITLRDEISDTTLSANGDRLWQVLVNLLTNAVRHTPSGRSVTLKTMVDSMFLEISVTDEGEGIPPEDLSRIFDRFYRVDASRNRETGGSGLGLAISKTIIKAHGGSIQASSQLGVGSTFLVRLPIRGC